MHGFLSIDKPIGITSHDVVARIRRVARQKRVGHAGTLDPAATGVLVVALGSATRLVEYVQEATAKRYQAVVRLGETTTTEDAEGEVLEQRPVPALDNTAIEAVLAQFRGPMMQVPPMYSALHHEGRRLHELAREGIVVERVARPITIELLTVLDYSAPLLTLDIICSKGTYIRSLARDIGEAFGCGAHLQALRRTAVGTFTIENTVPLDALVNGEVSLDSVLLPPALAVADWPRITVDDDEERQIRNGLPITRAELQGDRAYAQNADGVLLALLAPAEGRWRPTKVFDWS